MSRRPRSSRRRVATLALFAIVASASATVMPAPVQVQSSALPEAATIAGNVLEAARRFAIPEAWIWAVMRAESNGDVRAVSTAGAMGLMQIMPATWAGLRARHRLGTDPFDPRDNILAGAAYLHELHDRYGNVTAMLAAYNAGAGRYDEHLSHGRPLPAETRAYLAKLASITGGVGDTQLAAARPPDPFTWRRAALFPVRSDAASGRSDDADNPVADKQPARSPDDQPRVAMAAATSPSDLFVPLTGRSSR